MTTPTVRPTGTRPRKRRKPNARWARLRSLAALVRAHPRDTVGQLVALGRLLIQARQVAGHGRFAAWFSGAYPAYSLRVAEEAMTAARRLDGLPLPLGRFAVSAVKVLSLRKVARSPALVDALAELVRLPGPPVTYSEARAAVSAVSPAAVYPRAGKGGERESPAEAMSRRLLDLVCADQVTSLYIAADHDGEASAVTLTVMGARPRTVTREYLTTAIAAAVGEEELRRCPHPEHTGANPLPPGMFNKRAHYCKLCDRRRVKEHEARKKARKGGGESTPAEQPT
jgi:hypothetical protein